MIIAAQRLRLADSCILAWVLLHNGACANAALLTYCIAACTQLDGRSGGNHVFLFFLWPWLIFSNHMVTMAEYPSFTSLAPVNRWQSQTRGVWFSSIQYIHLHMPTYKLSRSRAQVRAWVNTINVSQVRDMPWGKRCVFNLACESVQQKIMVVQMHWECIPGSGRSEVESARTNESSWFLSTGLTATVQVSQMITDERAPWWVCRDRTCNEERVHGGICNCCRILSETDVRCESCKTR